MSITKRKTKNGQVRWYAQVCVKGKRPSRTFEKHVDAVQWHEETEKILREGISLNGRITPGDMLFSEAADRFIVESRRSVSRAHTKSYENSRLQLVRSFGEKALMSEITPQDVAAHILKRMTEDGVGPSSSRTELSFLRMVYVKAIEWGVDYPSPELNLKRPKAKLKSREERLDRVIKPDELTAIFTEAKNRENNIYFFLLFLLFTGMRPSEVAHLYWNRLPIKEEKEALQGMWPVGYVDLDRGGFSKIGTKTNSRFVPAHPEALKIIDRLRSLAPKGKKLVFLDDQYISKHRAYLFYRRTMQTTVAQARINGRKLRRDINFYSFRHTARSAMEVCGIQTAVAETIIGHNDKSFKFTYIHISDEDLVREIAKLQFPGLNL